MKILTWGSYEILVKVIISNIGFLHEVLSPNLGDNTVRFVILGANLEIGQILKHTTESYVFLKYSTNDAHEAQMCI